jgi:hypothetical protein
VHMISGHLTGCALEEQARLTECERSRLFGESSHFSWASIASSVVFVPTVIVSISHPMLLVGVAPEGLASGRAPREVKREPTDDGQPMLDSFDGQVARIVGDQTFQCFLDPIGDVVPAIRRVQQRVVQTSSGGLLREELEPLRRAVRR